MRRLCSICLTLLLSVAGASAAEPASTRNRDLLDVESALKQQRLADWLVVRGQDPDGEEEEPLVTDRPDFTEASSSVGAGRVQLETGYTFVYKDFERDQTVTRGHGVPEALFRIGLTDEVELRVFWNYAWEREIDAGAADTTDGADDLSLGLKIELLDECGCIPETAAIVQMTLPTGAEVFSAREPTFGGLLTYSWSLPNDWSVGAQTGFNTGVEDFDKMTPAGLTVTRRDRHVVMSQSATVGIPLTEQVGMYMEYFGLYSVGRYQDFPEHYVDGGFTWLANNNLQFDIRFGKGLNTNADDFFTGAGLSKRW